MRQRYSRGKSYSRLAETPEFREAEERIRQFHPGPDYGKYQQSQAA